MKIKNSLLALVMILGACTDVRASDYCSSARAAPLKVGDIVQDIYWSDGDSGRANTVCFRISNGDAAETGAIGSYGGAKCEAERALGFAAKAYVLDLTRSADLIVTGAYGFDVYDRQIIDLSVDGADLLKTGIRAGHFKKWRFKNGRRLMPKPAYCEL